MTLALDADQFRLIDQGRRVTVAPDGELDVADANALRDVLHRLGDQGKDVILDLSSTTFIDCTILGVLVGSDRYFAGRRLRLVVRNPRPGVMRVLALTGVAAVLTVELSRPNGAVTLV